MVGHGCPQTFSQGSISPTFYAQLLRSQIPKALKDTYDLTIFFALLGSTSIKVVRKMLMNLSPGEGKIFKGQKHTIRLIKHLKRTIFLKKVKNILFGSDRGRGGGKGPLLPSPVDGHMVGYQMFSMISGGPPRF